MAGGAKVAHDIMLSTGMLTYFSVGDLVNISKGTIDVAGAGMDMAFNKHEGMFRETGEGVGEVAGSAMFAAANLDLMRHTASVYGKRRTFLGESFGGPDVFEAKAIIGPKKAGYATYFNELESGGFQKAGRLVAGKFKAIENGAIHLEGSPLGKYLSKRAKGGYLQMSGTGGKFIAGQGLVRGIAPFLVAGALGFAAKSVLGFAGGLVDEATRDYHREKRVHYDNRFFNTQRDEMSNYQTLGMAMNNYENRYQSTARIYHSR